MVIDEDSVKSQLKHELVEILKNMKERAKVATDVGWSIRFPESSDIVIFIDECIANFDGDEKRILWEIELLFAPTGTFQELSMANGWAQDYITIANKVDNIVKELKATINK